MSARAWYRAGRDSTRVDPPVMGMRNVRRMRTAIRSGVRGVTGAPLVFGLSVTTMAAGLLLLAGYLLVVQNVRGVLASYGDDLGLVAFLATATEPERVDALSSQIGALGPVAEVSYVSPGQALERLRTDLGEDGQILEGLAANPLPGSFEVELEPEARTPEAAAALAARLLSMEAVDDVRYGAAWIESYARILFALEWIGAGLGASLLLVLGVIVAGTVRLAVHSRADEIHIQRLVGAGRFYVRLPFYFEAALQGALGSALALGVLYGLHELGFPLVADTLQRVLGIATPSFLAPPQVAGLLMLGIGLGLASAALALVRLDRSP